MKDNDISSLQLPHLLYEKEWIVIGKFDNWDPNLWPMPEFSRIVENSNIAYKVSYLDSNPNKVIKEEKCTIEEAEKLPKDCLMGSGSVEIRLTKLLQ